MDFIEAMQLIRHGDRLKRQIWDDQSAFCSIQKGRLAITKSGDDRENPPSWIIGEADLYANDWETVADA